MKFEFSEIERIKSIFAEMQRIEDFLHVIHEVQKLLQTDKIYKVTLSDLLKFHNNEHTEVLYRKFVIKKKSGGSRVINAPNEKLLIFQQALGFILQSVFNPHQAAYGFIWNKSICGNAQKHVGKRYVYNIDLQDFFPSIIQGRVYKCLTLKPFDLYKIKINGESYDFSEKYDDTSLASLIANLCTALIKYEVLGFNQSVSIMTKRALPQGAPTSPILTNIVCQRLDFILSGVAKRFGLEYTRYVDDITFSSMHNVYKTDSEFIKELIRVIKEQGFRINASKTRLQKHGYRQEVTGLVVNEKVNVTKRFVKQIRMWLYYWESYGYERASEFFRKDYCLDRSHSKAKWKKVKMLNVVGGKIEYLGMVKGKDNSTYKMLKIRYDRLIGNRNKINKVLKIWETKGIEAAILFYESSLKL
jgi:RNA-directed DNA polymerase